MSESGIFKAAVKLAASERAKYLDEACGGNRELRREVESLLRAHEKADSFLEASPAAVATVERAPAERPGLRIGRYRLLEQIGEGGMGTVWVAEQTEPVKRRVALKLIKPGMDSRQVLSRFEAERQALALMDHPNIAKVYDGGMTDEGRPYFVMEYVKGMPITEYCDRARLSIQERLKLFIPVCQAVQHAHQKGIIHRDLKPSNILVCLYDGQPIPKVIDFGLAKAMHQPLTEHTLYTAHGLMVGTPIYMSPEQAEFNNLDVDTRTDIYSLGVILYELLTGTTPLEKKQFKDAAFQEILRLIKDVEPQRPSLKLSTSATLPAIAAQRSLEPAQLSRAVKGDLDWIVMKSLEKERSRRYETANGLARDIERYLANEPVHARPPSSTYRLRKFAERNKAAVAAGFFIAISLLLGTAVSTWLAVRATRAERLATERLVQKQTALEEANNARQDTARELARAVNAEKEAQLARLDAESNLGKARRAVQQMLTRVAEDKLAYIPQVEEVRSKLFDDALQFYEELLQKKDIDPSIRLESSAALLRAANMARVLGKDKEAESRCRLAVSIMEEMCRQFPDNERFQLALSDAYHGLGEVLRPAGGATASLVHEAEVPLLNAIRLRDDLARRFPNEPDYRQRTSVSYRWLSLALKWDPNRQQEATNACSKAVEISQRLVSEYPSSPDYLMALASAHYTLSAIMANVKDSAARKENLEQAIKLFERLDSLASSPAGKFSRELGTSHQGLGVYRHDFGNAYCALGDEHARNGEREAATAAYTKGIAILEKLVADFPSIPMYRTGLSGVVTRWAAHQRKWGLTDEAEAALSKRLALDESKAGEADTASAWRGLATTCGDMARFYASGERLEEAEGMFRRAIELYDKNAVRFAEEQANAVEKVYVQLGLALVLSKLNRVDEEQQIYREVLKLNPNDSAQRNIKYAWLFVGIANYRLGMWAETIDAMEHSMVARNGGNCGEWFSLAAACARLGRQNEAREWFTKGSEWMDKNGPNDRTNQYFRKMAEEALASTGD